MSFIKQILSPFVEFEDDKKKQTDKVPAQNTPPPVPQYNPPAEEPAEHPLITGSQAQKVPQGPPVTASGTITGPLPEHKQYFEKLIDDANATNPFFQGTDFKEFIDSKSDIDNILDEETKYKTAFNVLKRLGLTKEKLVSTAHEYHNLIGRDMNAFQGAHSQNYNKEVKQREQVIEKKAAELRALTEKINVLKKEISDLSQEMVDTKNKLNLTKNSFLLAGENKQVEIQDELERIEKYF